MLTVIHTIAGIKHGMNREDFWGFFMLACIGDFMFFAFATH